MKKLLSVMLIVVMVFAMTACGNSNDAEYPDGTITSIVNFSAGGGSDLAARALCDKAAELMGCTITTTNVTGGSGTVGAAELANEDPDGYTIGFVPTASMALTPLFVDGANYTVDDFDYICGFGQYGYGIVVNNDSEFKSMDDVIAAMKKGTLKFGITGYPQPFAMYELANQVGGSVEAVSYPSTTDMITDVMGGFLDICVADEASFAAYVRSGDVTLLAGCCEDRWISGPDVPSLLELGYDVKLEAYLAMVAPKGIDADKLAILRDAFETAAQDEKFIEIMNNANQHVSFMTGEDYEAFMKEKAVEFKDLYAKYGTN